MALVISNLTGSHRHEDIYIIYTDHHIWIGARSQLPACVRHSNYQNFADGPARDGRQRMAKQVRGIMIHTLYQNIFAFYIIRKGKFDG